MLLVVNVDRSTMIVDSHSHNVIGAMIAYAPPGRASVLALWFFENDTGHLEGTLRCYICGNCELHFTSMNESQ